MEYQSLDWPTFFLTFQLHFYFHTFCNDPLYCIYFARLLNLLTHVTLFRIKNGTNMIWKKVRELKNKEEETI